MISDSSQSHMVLRRGAHYSRDGVIINYTGGAHTTGERVAWLGEYGTLEGIDKRFHGLRLPTDAQ